jgi:hypothetical protein
MTSIPRRAAIAAIGCGLAILAAGCGSAGGGSAGGGSAGGRAAGSRAAGGSPAGASQPRQARAAVSAAPARLTRAELSALAARYLAIARPANRRLDVAFDGYSDAAHESLARARRDLRLEATTERRFDTQLLAIAFPSWIELTARALVGVNQRRIALTERQASAPTLAAMRALDHRHRAANAAVEAQVRLIRQFLGLPPPSTS